MFCNVLCMGAAEKQHEHTTERWTTNRIEILYLIQGIQLVIQLGIVEN